LATDYNVRISPPRFGSSGAEYTYDKNNKTIAKGVASIKYMSAESANKLLDMSQRNYTRFVDVLIDCKGEHVLDTRQLDNLIKIDYFSSLGNIPELARIRDICELFKYGEAKSISKDKVSTELGAILSKYSTSCNAKGKELKSYVITDMVGLLHECEDFIKSQHLPDLDLRNKIQNSIEILGYVDISTNKEEDRRKLLILDISPLSSKDGNGNVWAYRINARSLGSGKTARLSLKPFLYYKKPIQKGDIINIPERKLSKNSRGYWYILDYTIEI
jgi:hypothetical protein